jgi:hypothetical protein
MSECLGYARALYDYQASSDPLDATQYLSFVAGDTIALLDKSDPEWWLGELNEIQVSDILASWAHKMCGRIEGKGEMTEELGRTIGILSLHLCGGDG